MTTTERAIAYKQRILQALPAGMQFEPLMTLYLTDNTSADEIVTGTRAAEMLRSWRDSIGSITTARRMARERREINDESAERSIRSLSNR